MLSVGRLDPEKNPLLLADVFARLREQDPRWRLVVCGDGTMKDELAGALRAAGVEEHAELLGYVSLDGGLRDLYRNSHVFLHVSWTEGVPAGAVRVVRRGPARWSRPRWAGCRSWRRAARS